MAPPEEASAPVWQGRRGWWMDRGSQPKSRLASVTFAWEMLCLNRAGSMLNITSQRQDPEILIFCYKSIPRKIRSHAQTPCAQVSFWSIRPSKGYCRKTRPREAETDSSWRTSVNFYQKTKQVFPFHKAGENVKWFVFHYLLIHEELNYSLSIRLFLMLCRAWLVLYMHFEMCRPLVEYCFTI